MPSDHHAVGHSDADVLLHAVTDAILSAAALGDIGELFPDSDPAHRGRDSAEMLAIAWEKVAAAGFRVANVSCVVQTERPKLGTYKIPIRRRLAELLKIGEDCVGLSAKTGEGVGPVGRGEVIEARCVVLLEGR